MAVNRSERFKQFREFIHGGRQTDRFVRIEPTSYAATWAGRFGGFPTLDEQIDFNNYFVHDGCTWMNIEYEAIIPELKWNRQLIKEESDGSTYWQETIELKSGLKKRVVANKPGTISWLAEPAVKKESDFDLIDFYADQIALNADSVASYCKEYSKKASDNFLIPSAALLTAFEVYYLIDYPDMPLFFMDYEDRYIKSVKKVHQANLIVMEKLAKVGIECFFTGSAGLELLSPGIFEKAIIPFQREFNNRARQFDCISNYHICGHSRKLIECGVIDRIKPTIFETCSTPPCGNNVSLRAAVDGISPDIITKGNLELDLLRNGTVDEIIAAANDIIESTKHRRHIIGLADATIIEGTPEENIRAFIGTAVPLFA